MKLYLAGIYAANFGIESNLFRRLTDNEKKQRASVQYILESYHYVYRQSFVDKMRRDGVKIFLDSGAFSAFTKGVEVDMDAYCRYILENQDIIEVASVLDGIGDPLKTWQNQKRMEELGTRPLPCFHYGEDERYLEWYVANYDYITIGGMVPISTPQLLIWLDRIWNKYLVDGSGRPKVKVHGFGLTTLSLMERYPWFSVDSSSWVQIARTGGLMLPKGRVISVSMHSPSRKVARQHLDTLPEIMTANVVKELEGYGCDVQRAREIYLARWAFNCWSFGQINKLYDSKTSSFTETQMGLF